MVPVLECVTGTEPRGYFVLRLRFGTADFPVVFNGSEPPIFGGLWRFRHGFPAVFGGSGLKPPGTVFPAQFWF